MNDLDTRLRALADAGAAAAHQPTTEELLGPQRRMRPPRRKWLPVTAVAAATAGIVALAVTQPWHRPTGDPSMSRPATCPGARTLAFRLSGGASSPEQLGAAASQRVASMTTDSCVVQPTEQGGTVLVYLTDADRAKVTAVDFRSDLWVAPVTSECPGKCRVPAGTPVFAGANGQEYVVDATRKLDLSGHVAKSTSGLDTGSAGDWLVDLALDQATAGEFGVLTSRLLDAPSPGNQLAIVDHGRVLEAPVILGAITDGNLEIMGPYTEQLATSLARQLGAPSVPADVHIEAVPAPSASATNPSAVGRALWMAPVTTSCEASACTVSGSPVYASADGATSYVLAALVGARTP